MAAAKEITVYIDWSVYQRMSYWAKLGGRKSREFTCFARTTLESFSNGDPFFWISDAYLVKHEGNSSAVEIDEDDLAALMYKLDQDGVPPDEAFRCWVHSHPGSGPSATYLSGTDEGNIKKFMEQGTDWLVSIVFDSKGENPFTRVDFRSPVHHCIKAKLDIVYPILTQDELKSLEDEFNEKSRAKTYSYSTSFKGTGYRPGSYAPKGTTSSSGKGSGKGSGNKAVSIVSGFESNGQGNLGSAVTGMYAEELTDEEFWRNVALDYEDYIDEETDDGVEIVGFDDSPEGDMVIENGSIEVYGGSGSFGDDVFDEFLSTVVDRIQVGHMTASTGVDNLCKMGYSRARSEKAIKEALGLNDDAPLPS